MSQSDLWRAQIILATAEGCVTAEIMCRAGVSKPCVWCWRRRFMKAGLDGLLHDKTCKPRQDGDSRAGRRAIDRPRATGETTHWASRAMTGTMA
jgi:hypothetical protein